LVVSWKIGGSFSSLAPSSRARGDYNQDGIEGQMDGRDGGAH